MTNIKENTKQSHEAKEKQSHEAKEKQSDETNVNNKQIATAKTPRHDDANESVIANQSVIARGACTERSRSKAISPKETKSLKPKLRFKEFEGEWKETTLGELFTFKNGLNSDKEKYGSGIKFINVLDIIGEDVITYDSIIGMVEVTDKELKKNEVIFGDVLFQRSSETREEVGQANVYVDEKRSAVFGGFVIRGRKKVEYNPYFINYLLKTSPARKEITTKSGGSTRYNVGQESLSQVFVKLTGVKEQQKIANFLTAVDTKLQQLTTKAALLAQYKKGVMQQLFSQQLRFKPDNTNETVTARHEAVSPNETQFPDWEEKRLGEVCTFFSGGTPTSTNREYYSGIIPFIGSGNIYDSEVFNFISKEAFNSSSAKMVKERDLLYALYGANSGEVSISKLNGAINQAVLCIRTKESIEYLYYILLLNKDRITTKYLQGGQGNLSSKIIKNLKYYFPSLKEQQKIAHYLSAIDLKIEAVQTQITHTQQFKKGVLQQMFV